MSNKSAQHHAHNENDDQQELGLGWKRLHRSPVFWIGVVLVLAAMLTYVFTMNLATRPMPSSKQPAANTVP